MKKAKKNFLRASSFIIAALMACGTLMGCNNKEGDDTTSDVPVIEGGEALALSRTDACESYTTTTTEYQLNVDTIADGIFIYTEGSPERKGSGITLAPKTVSQLQVNALFDEGEKTVLKTQLQTNTIVNGSAHATLFIGLRLTDPARGANSQKGVWLAIRGNQIGMRVNNWLPHGAQFKDCAVDFSTMRTLYIEDDHVNNVIELFADDDQGKKVPIFRVELDGDRVYGFLPGSQEADLRNKLEEEIPDAGYINFWVHYTEVPVILKDLTITGTKREYASTTYADPLFISDVFSDTWVATDDENRTVAQVTANGIKDKQVGMFYFINASGNGEYHNHSEIYYGDDNGKEGYDRIYNTIVKDGAHYWAEPYFGYYEMVDEWVIRKHAHMLNDAGVDFIFMDVTNGITFKSTYEKILNTYSEMREEGCEVPKIMFHCGTIPENVSKTLSELYGSLYSKDRYRDLWFEWEGRPLIFADDATVNKASDEIKSKFTFRDSWAYSNNDWYTDTDGKGCWPWADPFPQAPGLSPEGEVEQMVVMSGYWANSIYGRSYSNGRQPANSEFSFELTTNGTSGKGLAYQEQFDRALKTDPKVLMLIGWNEWSAGKHSTDQLHNDGQTIAGTYKVDSGDPIKKYSYIDCFSPEYSRDVEPVKGLFKDNYYYQTALNVRQAKGTRAIAGAFGQKTIDMAGGDAQWYAVGPEYRDYKGDTFHRDCDAAVKDIHYTNTTGRNDFVVAKVSADNENVYFYAECASDITAAEGTNWMNLFIDADCDASTGWYGYDYIINRSQNGSMASVEKLATTEKNAEWSVSSAGEAEFKVTGKTITIKIPKSVIALGNTFDFKWADNSVSDGKEILQFLDLGDTAPNGRFNYRYTTEGATVAAPACLTSDMVVLKANSYNAYVDGKQVMINEGSTRATALGEKGRIYLPEAFAKDTLGLADGLKEVGTHYGVKYVDVNDALAAQNKVITVSGDGLIVIWDKEITDTSTLDVLYRALM